MNEKFNPYLHGYWLTYRMVLSYTTKIGQLRKWVRWNSIWFFYLYNNLLFLISSLLLVYLL